MEKKTESVPLPDFSLQTIILTDDDSHTMTDYLKPRRVNITRGRAIVQEADLEVVLYSLRYLMTFDAAVTLTGPKSWLLFLKIDGTLHFPLACGNHFLGLRNVCANKSRTIHFVSVIKEDLTMIVNRMDAGMCKCRQLMESGVMDEVHAPVARYFKSNVDIMLSRVDSESAKALAPYNFQVQEAVVGCISGEESVDDSGESDTSVDVMTQNLKRKAPLVIEGGQEGMASAGENEGDEGENEIAGIIRVDAAQYHKWHSKRAKTIADETMETMGAYQEQKLRLMEELSKLDEWYDRKMTGLAAATLSLHGETGKFLKGLDD
jgi:hypothetical protein